MRPGLFETINRPPGRFFARLRIDNPVLAYFASCIASTATVAALFIMLGFWEMALHDRWAQFDPAGALIIGVVPWIFVTGTGAIVAAPFVAGATWAGRQFGIESAPYYVLAATGSAVALILPLVGVPEPNDFSLIYFVWEAGLLCAAAWGAAWWYLHRRWKSPAPGPGPVS